MKKKNITIDDLALMVNRRFDELDKGLNSKLDNLTQEVKDGFDRSEYSNSSNERRISVLEDKVRQISVKVGLSK